MVLEGRFRCINSRRRSRIELIFASGRQHHALIGDLTLLHGFPKDYFAAEADRSKCLHATSSNALFCTHYVGNVIYHKFSHDDISYRFNGENVNAMLEFTVVNNKMQSNRSCVIASKACGWHERIKRANRLCSCQSECASYVNQDNTQGFIT